MHRLLVVNGAEFTYQLELLLSLYVCELPQHTHSAYKAFKYKVNSIFKYESPTNSKLVAN